MNNEVLGYLGLKLEKHTEYAIDYVAGLLLSYKKATYLDESTFVSGSGHRKSIYQRQYQEMQRYLERLKAYAKHIKICGEERNSYSKTDHDATFMRLKRDYMGNDQLLPAYNLQAAVCEEYIAVVDVKPYASDMECFVPLMKKFNRLYGHYPKAGAELRLLGVPAQGDPAEAGHRDEDDEDDEQAGRDHEQPSEVADGAVQGGAGEPAQALGAQEAPGDEGDGQGTGHAEDHLVQSFAGLGRWPGQGAAQAVDHVPLTALGRDRRGLEGRRRGLRGTRLGGLPPRPGRLRRGDVGWDCFGCLSCLGECLSFLGTHSGVFLIDMAALGCTWAPSTIPSRYGGFRRKGEDCPPRLRISSGGSL